MSLLLLSGSGPRPPVLKDSYFGFIDLFRSSLRPVLHRPLRINARYPPVRLVPAKEENEVTDERKRGG